MPSVLIWSLNKDDTLTVSLDVQNTGKFAGEEVLQLDVKHLASAVARPLQELRGFKRVALKSGERRTVEIPLPAKSLAFWDATRHAFVVEPGKVQLRVGARSADIRMKKTVAVLP